MFTTHEPSYATVEVTWAEYVTLLRLRRGWDKKKLAEETGISRTWLWRALECKPGEPRHVELSDEHKLAVMEALMTEATEEAA